MIYLLNSSTDKLQITTSATAAIDVNCNYVDISSTTFDPSGLGRQNQAISTATTTDVLATPAATTIRTLKQMTARNKDATNSNDLTVIYNANGTSYELHKVTLQPSEALEYIEGVGFFTLKAANVLDKVLIVANDIAYSTAATFADITGLTCPLLSGKKYTIFASLFHISGVSTTGAQFGYNIGAAPTVSIFGNYSGVTNSVTAGVMSLGVATARDTALTAQTTGSAANTVTLISGMVQPSADGTFALRATAEVAATMTVKAGSYMYIRQEK